MRFPPTLPVQVEFTPDGHRVYVSLRDENSVAVIDTAKQKVINKIKVGKGPNGITFRSASR